MRVIRYDNYGAADVLALADVDMPRPGPGEIRIVVRAIGVNPADGKWRAGLFASFAPLRFPHVPGYDLAGTVDALGEDVAGIALGDRVCVMLGARHGAYAEAVVVEVATVAHIPAELDFATAAALPTAALTGLQMVEAHLRPTPGDTVVVTGAAGAVGRFAVHAAKAMGCRVIAAVRAMQVDEARTLGADEVIRLGSTDVPSVTVTHVIDTIGGPDIAGLCRTLQPTGKILTVATAPIETNGLPTDPVFIAVENDPGRLEAIARSVACGTIPVPIAMRMPLASAAEAQRLTETGGNGGKIILEP